MATKIQLRRDTGANWTATNPVLAEGEVGIDLSNNRMKVGDGAKDWKTLQYTAGDAAIWSRTGTVVSPTTAGDTVQISAGTAAQPGLTPVGEAATGLYSPGAGQLAISTNNTERLRITPDGKLGLGTSNVTHTLTVTTAGTDAVKINTADYGYLELSSGTSAVRLQNVQDVPRVGTATDHPLAFAVNEHERMRVNRDGSISLINTALPTAPPAYLMTVKADGVVNLANAPTYADNTAALAGGLVAGDVYRTATGQLMITF